MTHRFPLAIGLIAVGLLFAGCSAANAEQDLTAHATLDYTNTQVILPVSEYQVSNKDWRLIVRTRERVLSACMKKLGVDDSFEVASYDVSSIDQDRPYGMWNVESAKKYGFEKGPTVPSTDAKEDARWLDARNRCGDSEASLLASMTPAEGVPPTPSENITSRSTAAAAANPDSAKIRSEWAACLAKHGLQAVDNENSWSSKQAMAAAENASANREEDIRIATLEATCNQDVHATQRLSDLVASYQAPMIKADQAALNAEKQTNVTLVANAKQYMATHG